MTVKAWLIGRSSDLDTLADLFGASDPSVKRDSDGVYYLTSPSLDNLFGRGGELYNAAASRLEYLNGLARVYYDTHRPVELNGQFSSSTGSNHSVVRPPTIESTGRVGTPTVIGGSPQSPARPGPPDYVLLANQHPDVAEALGILAKSRDFSWDDLHKVYEIVRANVGGSGNNGTDEQRLRATNWLPLSDHLGFRNSANTKSISGDAARHARGQQPTTPDTMTLREGREMISRLVLKWLDTL